MQKKILEIQYLHILKVVKKLNDHFSQFNNISDTAVLPNTTDDTTTSTKQLEKNLRTCGE